MVQGMDQRAIEGAMYSIMEQLIDQVVNLRKLENAFVTYPFSESQCDANPCVCVRSAMALLDVDLGVYATIALLS